MTAIISLINLYKGMKFNLKNRKF